MDLNSNFRIIVNAESGGLIAVNSAGLRGQWLSTLFCSIGQKACTEKGEQCLRGFEPVFRLVNLKKRSRKKTSFPPPAFQVGFYIQRVILLDYTTGHSGKGLYEGKDIEQN